MTHRLCTPETGGALPYVQRLWRTLLAPTVDPLTKLEHLFEQETAEFDLEYAFLSCIDLEDETERFEIVHGSHKILQQGTTVPLSRTYCRKTIADPKGTLAVSDALAEGWEADPAYDTFTLGSYLGTTVSVADDLYGTLGFANTAARDEPIREEEKALIEMYGQWVAFALDSCEPPPIRGPRLDAIEGRAVSTDAIDLMMEVLCKRTRRVILMTLMGDTTETSIDTLEQQLPHENPRNRLYHSDLPKLATAGYITWDADSDIISKGPKFSEVEPLVQLLNEYNTAFPD